MIRLVKLLLTVLMTVGIAVLAYILIEAGCQA